MSEKRELIDRLWVCDECGEYYHGSVDEGMGDSIAWDMPAECGPCGTDMRLVGPMSRDEYHRRIRGALRAPSTPESETEPPADRDAVAEIIEAVALHMTPSGMEDGATYDEIADHILALLRPEGQEPVAWAPIVMEYHEGGQPDTEAGVMYDFPLSRLVAYRDKAQCERYYGGDDQLSVPVGAWPGFGSQKNGGSGVKIPGRIPGAATTDEGVVSMRD